MDITIIIKALVALLSAAITGVLIPWIKSKTDELQYEQIRNLVGVAVAAAEQIYLGTGRGAEKKAFVVHWLDEHNVAFDADEIDAIIEAEVFKLREAV